MAASPDGRRLYVACATANRVLVLDTVSRKTASSLQVPGSPTGLCLSRDGRLLFVTCAGPANHVCIVDTVRGRIMSQFSAGHTPMAPVLSPNGETLFGCNRFNNSVSVFEPASGRELRRIAVRREPVAAALTPDGRRLLVANFLHTGRANVDHAAAVVSVIDTALGEVVDDLSLPSGSGALNDIRVSPDGKYAVVTHVLASFQRPTTQVERGWMNSNAATFIALDQMEVLNTVALDEGERGAANPWGAAWSDDSKTLVIAHAGTHEVSIIDVGAVVERLLKLRPAPLPVVRAYGTPAQAPADVRGDFAFLGKARRRQALPDNDLGPRGVVVVGRRAYTANYFSDTLSVINLATAQLQPESISLSRSKGVIRKSKSDLVRQGELWFHDARLCRQGWQSCASCHPGEGRMDGLNWDLLNDGMGNPKNTRSLLFAHATPPAMSLGVRETSEFAVRSGIQHILFANQPPKVADSIDAYLRSLTPLPSPHLVGGRMSPGARRGEKLFRNKEVGCIRCHPPPLFTDLHSYDVGTRGPLDKPADMFDTPTLIELWRTAPYLHDGSAADLRDLLTFANANDQHGHTSQLTADQILDLCEYLLSL